jgi:outer membrane lipoprotein SlyB
MKKLVVLSTLTLASLCYAQQDIAVVVARTPRYVTMYQQQCGTQEIVRSNNGSGGAVVGGLAGAALGSTIGHNHRDSLAGGVAGALIGPDTVEQRTVCRNVPVTMQQGEVVTFQYQGRTFSQTFP